MPHIRNNKKKYNMNTVSQAFPPLVAQCRLMNPNLHVPSMFISAEARQILSSGPSFDAWLVWNWKSSLNSCLCSEQL